MGDGPNARLFPPELLFKKRPPCVTQSLQVPFRPPGPSAAIPPRPSDPAPVQYLRAVRLRSGLSKLIGPLHEIEEDTSFVKSAMDAALLVPRAIERTFERVHGKLYDIQTAISLGDEDQKRAAFRIQLAVRAFLSRRKFQIIRAAMRRSIARDGMPLRTMLLSLTLSYGKRDEGFRLRVNRRFVNRAREGARFWQRWSVEEAARWVSIDRKILELRASWQRRYLATIARRWLDLASGPHARKVLRALADGVSAEARERGISRAKVLIGRGIAIGNAHRVKVFMLALRSFVQAARLAGRRARMRARDFRFTHVKRRFLRAWLALSIGRVSVFGGWTRWFHPVNRRAVTYQRARLAMRSAFSGWFCLCARKAGCLRLRAAQERRKLREVFLGFRSIVMANRQESQRGAGVIAWGRKRMMRRVFHSWAGIVVKAREVVVIHRLVMARNTRERLVRARRRMFHRWLARFLDAQAGRFEQVGVSVYGFTGMWYRAGREMESSLRVIGLLRDKLAGELATRRREAARARVQIGFLGNEARCLAHAVQNCKIEIEAVQEQITKSALRFFVPIKPVRDGVLKDVPKALREYIEHRDAGVGDVGGQRSIATIPDFDSMNGSVARGQVRHAATRRASVGGE